MGCTWKMVTQWVLVGCNGLYIYVYIYIYTPSDSYGTSPRVRSTVKMICKWSISKLFLHCQVFDRRSVKG